MSETEVIAAIQNLAPDVKSMEHEGITFFFTGAERMFPFATIVPRDEEYDRFSNLDRPGVYRLNFEMAKAAFRERFSGANPDFRALDILMPHPVYGANSWVSILNPSPGTFGEIRRLVEASYRLAKYRQERKLDRDAQPETEV